MFVDTKKTGNYYDILKIKPDATDEQVRRAYAALVRQYHPDFSPQAQKRLAALRFRLINEAYSALKTPEGRDRYNRLLLTRRGKPKGLNLRADNDNAPQIQKTGGLWDTLAGLFTSQKESAINSNIAQNEPSDGTSDDRKDREHG